MSSVPLRAALLALLVVVSGCAGVTPQSPEDTQSPEATTTDATGSELAPRVSEQGVEDPGALVEAHGEHLTDRSLTLETLHVERYENGSVKARTVKTIRVASNRSFYRVVLNATGPKPTFLGGSEGRLEQWANGTHVFRALTVNGSTSYGIVYDAQSTPAEPRERLRGGLALSDQLRVVFTAFGDERVERIDRDENGTGPVAYRITATELDHPDLLGPSGVEVRNATLTAVVEVGGPTREMSKAFVRNWTLRYATTKDGETVRVTEEFRFSNVGQTSVERPPWHSEVTNRTASEG